MQLTRPLLALPFCALIATLVIYSPLPFTPLLAAALATYCSVTILARLLALHPSKARGYVRDSALLDNGETMAGVVVLTLQIMLMDPVLRQALQTHSRFQKQPLVRILRTMTAFELVARGSAKDRRKVAEWIRNIHGGIGGEDIVWTFQLSYIRASWLGENKPV
jgi:hypothetical protein